MSINEFLIEYKINKDERKVRIFGYEFVRKNKNKCLVEYNNKKFNCTEFIDIDDSSRNEINKNNSIKIKIKLIFINEIIDFQYMFYECSSLLKFTNYSRFFKIIFRKIIAHKFALNILTNNVSNLLINIE